MTEFFIEWGPAGLFLFAFLAATLLPFSSEVALLALLQTESAAGWLLLAATAGNLLGSVVNYALGFWLGRVVVAKRLHLSDAAFERAETRYRRYGVWALLFAWVPVIGDPITLVAGVLRVNFWLFVLLVGLGKFARYAVIVYLAVGP
jgi:membrane protein YqaA with SNARE-associated domain